MNNYKVGDRVGYSPFGGGIRLCRVTAREADVKNGRPGFVGYGADGMDYWGYDDQILFVSIEHTACHYCGARTPDGSGEHLGCAERHAFSGRDF